MSLLWGAFLGMDSSGEHRKPLKELEVGSGSVFCPAGAAELVARRWESLCCKALVELVLQGVGVSCLPWGGMPSVLSSAPEERG